ncbi:hypothetical protein ASE04_29425 [Rhizobium sp. Root708]|uniref:hypothetical protein n=1 Tax=Rhizobium sp. Root708 TaxID=1736592 RepID=UPI0007019680|nr:hypothetical protein [Rhizobium sp. Root708]KRB53788.1 hypothetical protein ASE04_29425 [Rhizobium sp. Root708]
MTVVQSAILLLTINLGLLALLMRLPLGQRTLSIRRTFNCTREKLWSAVNPSGDAADWHHSVLSSKPIRQRGNLVEQTYKHLDRHGAPLRRLLAVEPLDTANANTVGYRSSVVDDSTLDPSFWKNFQECRIVRETTGGVTIEITQTDRYRGLAFLIVRYFSLRREMRALEGWLKTGHSAPQGYFEHPLVQVLLAIVSTLLLWPFLGLTIQGLMISTFLTLVIVLHELGHMAAYRMFGHPTVRMIFIPLLGGVAIGGRPYRSLFEVGTCALMGAGMSAFLVPPLCLAEQLSEQGVLPASAGNPILVFLLILGAFNLLNLLPMHRFDGGQVLRQIFRSRSSQIAASFFVTLCILCIGFTIGLPARLLTIGLLVFTVVSLIGARSIKPRHQLDEMTDGERMMVAFGLYSAIAMHGYAIVFAVKNLF